MNYHQLTKNERCQIYVLNKAGHSQKEIATLIGRSPSTISRELKRNKGLRGYRPQQAQRLTDNHRKIAKKARKIDATIYYDIATLIRQELSPQQIPAVEEIRILIVRHQNRHPKRGTRRQ